jgi:hypothetical protein
MTQPTYAHKSQLLGVATTLSAVAALMVPAAQADRMLPLAPACDQYAYPEGFTLQQADGWRVELTGNGPFPDGFATATKQGQTPMHGSVSGGIQGRHADFRIDWDTGPVGHYTGDVDDSGIAHGTGVDEAHPTSSSTWNSTVPFECATQTGERPTLTGRYKVDIDDAFETEGHPFRGTQTWDITSRCSSQDSCTATVTPDHHKWTGTATFGKRTDVATMGLWTMVVDLPNALICQDGSGTRVHGQSVYTWGPFITGNGVPTQSSDGSLDWSHDPGCGKPAETKGAVFTMTKIG